MLLILVSNSEINDYTSINSKIKTCAYRYPRSPFRKLCMIYEIIAQISFFSPDIVHLQGLWPYFIPILFWLRITHRRIVITFHDVTLHQGEWSALRSLSQHIGRKYADGIIVHGIKLKDIMQNKYCIDKNKICSIHIGEHEVDPFKRYEDPFVRNDENSILFFGRIQEYKGLEYLIKAEPFITEQIHDAKIIIAGEGEPLIKYKKMMINHDNFIVYNYRIPYKEGAKLFQKCSVVVLPYTDGSQSGVVPTAYAFKKPVIVTNVGSIPEIVEEGRTGFIVPPRNPEALAKAIIRLLKNPQLREEMGENAYTKLKEEFSWGNIGGTTIELYKEVLRL